MVYREVDHLRVSCCAQAQRELTEWFRRSDADLFRSEQRALSGLLGRTPGENVLQMGLETLDYITDLNAGRRIWREPIIEDERSRLIRRLSFADGCMHVVILPHLLECVAQPALALREANRLLCAGGWLFVVGFFPMSVSRRLPSVVCQRRHSPAYWTRVLSFLDFNQMRWRLLTTSPWSWSEYVPGLRRAFVLSARRWDFARPPPLRERSPSEATVSMC